MAFTHLQFSLRNLIIILITMIFITFTALETHANPSGFYYQVQSGETLETISRRYQIPVQQLAQQNRLTPSSRLAVGSRLWIPQAQPQATANNRRVLDTRGQQTRRVTPNSNINSARQTPQPQRQAAPRQSPSPQPAQQSRPASQPSSGSYYTVQNGDSLWLIARRYGVTVTQLADWNGLNPERPLHVGQELRIFPGGADAPRDVPGGGVEVTIRRNTPPQHTPENAARPSRHGYIWPIEGRILKSFTNRSDEKYMGIDIEAPAGTAVRAARDGEVVYVGSSIPFYGNMVIVNHANGWATCYAHNETLLVRQGQRVRQGDIIARSGGRGNSERYLHFQLRRNGEAVNPMPYLP